LSKYLVLYRSSVPASEQMGGSDADAAAGMELWMNWAGRVGNAMADMGSPLSSVATIEQDNARPTDPGGPSIGGFSILEAESLDALEKLLDDHPHFHAPGDPSIEVLEFLPIPGM
jgi:hypothetical protein